MPPSAIADFNAVVRARPIIREHFSPVPLIRSYALEKALGLPDGRRVWMKDYGWTPVGSFKLMGALNWLAHHADEIGDRPIAAHSSGNFASGLAFAGEKYGKRVIIVMPDNAPQIKFDRTRSFGAEIRTYDITNDHETGLRDRMTREIAEVEHAVQASPYDDNDVIAGNGVGGLEIVEDLQCQGRKLSNFVCPISGGGLMAGHALAIHAKFPDAQIIGVEPSGADDFRRSLEVDERLRVERPQSICDGLLSYDVGVQNWPILHHLVKQCVCIDDSDTIAAMRWLEDQHGLRSEPSGAIALAAAMFHPEVLQGNGDIVVVISGRNVDAGQFRRYLDA